MPTKSQEPQNRTAIDVRLLVIEDDIDDFYILQQSLLKHMGENFILRHVFSLKDSQKILIKDHFDLILLDLNLPETSGLDTLKLLIKICPYVPIVVLTGIDDEELGREAIKIGAADYVAKDHAYGALLSRSIHFSIERHKLLLEIKRQAELDGLTRLLNRTTLLSKIETVIEQCTRNRSPLALALFDIDNFKEINDTWGHQAGDQLLKSVADRMMQNLRRSDIAGRYGGDEFVLVMTNYNNLAELAEHKHEQLSKPHAIQIDGKQHMLNAGISMGVAEWNESLSISELVKCADEAMYQSKRNGKNAIFHADAHSFLEKRKR